MWKLVLFKPALVEAKATKQRPAVALAIACPHAREGTNRENRRYRCGLRARFDVIRRNTPARVSEREITNAHEHHA